MAGVTIDSIVEAHSASHSFPMLGCKGSAWLAGNGNKRLTENQRIERNGLQMKQDFDASSVSRSLFLFVGGSLLRNHWADGKLRAFKKIMCLSADRRSGSRHSTPFYVGFTVEDFAAQLDISYAPFAPVVLKCPAAHFQPCRHFLVCEETLSVQCRAVVGGQILNIVQQTVETVHEVDYPLTVFVN